MSSFGPAEITIPPTSASHSALKGERLVKEFELGIICLSYNLIRQTPRWFSVPEIPVSRLTNQHFSFNESFLKPIQPIKPIEPIEHFVWCSQRSQPLKPSQLYNKPFREE